MESIWAQMGPNKPQAQMDPMGPNWTQAKMGPMGPGSRAQMGPNRSQVEAQMGPIGPNGSQAQLGPMGPGSLALQCENLSQVTFSGRIVHGSKIDIAIYIYIYTSVNPFISMNGVKRKQSEVSLSEVKPRL